MNQVGFKMSFSFFFYLGLRVAVPSPRGQTGGRKRSLTPVCPQGEGTATRRLFLPFIDQTIVSKQISLHLTSALIFHPINPIS